MKKQFLSKILISFMVITNNFVNAQQWGLYTLYAPNNGVKTFLIDTNGIAFKTWTFDLSHKTGFSVYLIPGDTLLRPVAHSNQLTGVALTGEVQKVTWDGTVVWDYVHSSSTYCLHHDICPMPNGNILMIAYELKTVSEASQSGCSSAIEILPEKIIEVKPTGPTTGTIVWEWHLWDHLCQNYDSTKDNYVCSVIDNPQLMNINYKTLRDWWHMNGIDYNPVLDQISVSSRKMNEIYIIDHSTTTVEAAGHTGGNSGKGGDFLYRWGNPEAYGDTGTTNFNVVHDAHWISASDVNYPNYLCGFNNNGGTGGKSCIDIISPPYNGYNYSFSPGQPIPPSTYAYRHTSDYNTPFLGSSEQLPNGNMLVCISTEGYIYEINSSGTTLWSKTVIGQPVNAIRYDKCYVRGPQVAASASSTTVTSGTPITLYSSAISVTETSPSYTYSWSSNPSGFTSNSQNPTDSPISSIIYTVTITDTIAGCSDTSSVTVDVVTGINNDTESDKLYMYPNPTKGIINIEYPIIDLENTEIIIFDICGNPVFQSGFIKSIDLEGFENGIYFLSVSTGNIKNISDKIILIK
ncbi:MAG: aryl-sulfate sulfotransferase [Bacteroidota bacterium]